MYNLHNINIALFLENKTIISEEKMESKIPYYIRILCYITIGSVYTKVLAAATLEFVDGLVVPLVPEYLYHKIYSTYRNKL